MNYENLLPPPQYKKSAYKNGDTNDIVAEVIKCYNLNHAQAAKLAAQLQGSNLKQTCSNIWHFIKNNVRYKIDPEGYQWVRTPSRLVADGEGDCKSFSVLAASCLKCLGVTPTFRFTSYNSSPTPTHVYVVVKQKQGKEIIIDAVINGFNTQKPYTHKKDITMAKIATLSGVTEDSTKAYFEQSKAINAAILKSLLPAIAKAEAAKNAGYIKTPLLTKINTALAKLDNASIGAFNPAVLQANQNFSTTPYFTNNAPPANWNNLITSAANVFSGNGNAVTGLVSTGLSMLGPVGTVASTFLGTISNVLGIGPSNPTKDWETWDALDARQGNPPGGQARWHMQDMPNKTPSSIERTMVNLISWIKNKGELNAFKFLANHPSTPLTPQQLYTAFKIGGQEAAGMALANAYSAFLNPQAVLPYGTNDVVTAANNSADDTPPTQKDGLPSWILPVAGALVAAKVFKVI